MRCDAPSFAPFTGLAKTLGSTGEAHVLKDMVPMSSWNLTPRSEPDTDPQDEFEESYVALGVMGHNEPPRDGTIVCSGSKSCGRPCDGSHGGGKNGSCPRAAGAAVVLSAVVKPAGGEPSQPSVAAAGAAEMLSAVVNPAGGEPSQPSDAAAGTAEKLSAFVNPPGGEPMQLLDVAVGAAEMLSTVVNPTVGEPSQPLGAAAGTAGICHHQHQHLGPSCQSGSGMMQTSTTARNAMLAKAAAANASAPAIIQANAAAAPAVCLLSIQAKAAAAPAMLAIGATTGTSAPQPPCAMLCLQPPCPSAAECQDLQMFLHRAQVEADAMLLRRKRQH